MEFKLTVTDGEMGVIASALMELPYKISAPLLGKLDAQIAAQQTPPAEEAPAEAEEQAE